MLIVSTAVKQVVLFGKNKHVHIFKRLVFANKWLKRNMPRENIPPHRNNPVILTMDTPEFKSICTPELETLVNMFKKYNYEIRVAGGAVRDLLMGITPKDLDFATTATPTQMKEMFAKEEVRLINTNGEKHGTITSRINDKENFEVTTLRIDVVTDGRHADVEFTTDWLLDASRRDLTINSMFLDIDGKVYDYFYGYEDLMKRKIAFVGNPAQRIQEDFLRIFRYFRFYGRIADVPDNHDEKVIQAIKDNVEGLERISGERIWAEWNKILHGNFNKEITLKLIECGCAKYMGLPEKLNIKHFNEIHAKAQKNNVNLQPSSLIAAMLYTQQELHQLHLRLKFPNIDRNTALFIIQYRSDDLLGNRPLAPYQKLVLKTIGKVSEMKYMVCEFLKYKGALKHLEDFEKWDSRFPITGIMLKPIVKDNMKLISGLMIKLKDAWVDSDFKMSNEQLLSYASEILVDVTIEFEEISRKRKQEKEERRQIDKACKKTIPN